MAENREGFVVWIEIDKGTPPKLSGAAEWTRTAVRIDFATADELARFFESCVGEARGPSDNEGPSHALDGDAPKSLE